MIKKIIFLFLFGITLQAYDIKLEEIHFVTENDADFRQDNDYTFGSEIGALFSLNDMKKSDEEVYFSLTYDWQIFTPKDLKQTDIIKEDRPYAGYQYIKASLHRANPKRLHTLALQLGFIGPDTKMQQVQNAIHSLIGSPHASGWEHQLKNEMIVQLNYSYRRFIELSKTSVLLPEAGFELGNASTKGYAMLLYRYGNDVRSDFGSSMMDNTNYYKIPRTKASKKRWRYALQLSLKTNLIARDIFLDGNTFRDSHSVDKEIFTLQIGYGVDIAYKKWHMSYLRRHSSKEFKTQNRYHNYGSLVLSYQY